MKRIILLIIIIFICLGCRYKKYYIDVIMADLSKGYLILVNKYYYLNDDYVPNDLELISDKYNKGSNNMLRHDARIMFELMCEDASKNNIIIYNLSAYRSYNNQVYIYDYNVRTKGQQKADMVSARAGFSEHQSGLCVDVNRISLDFSNTLEFNWLVNNSHKYGYILRYPKDKEKITGYSYEPWHFRYVGVEVAKKIVELDITFDEYYSYYLS